MTASKAGAALKNRSLRRVVKVAGQALMLVALYFVALRLLTSWKQVSASLAQMQLLPLVGAALLTLIMLLLMSTGWTLALAALGAYPGFRTGFYLYYWASLYRYLPGAIWHLPGRAYLCQKRGISLATFTRSALLELFLLLSSGGILAALGLARHLGKPVLNGLSLPIGLAIAAVLLWPDALLKFRQKPGASPEAPVRRAWLIGMLAVYLGVWFSYGSAVTLALQALPVGRLPGLLAMVTTNTAAWAAGFLSLAPVGLGVRELSLSVLLGPGLGAAAILASLTQRIMEVILEAFLWLAARLAVGRVD
jgi:uncharacterized membrane protein YbhN (UPF0104 family)